MNPFEGTRPTLRTVLLTVAAMVVVAVTLLRVPLATIFTFGVLLVCPLLMIGMRGGDHNADHGTSDEVRADRTDGTGDGGRRVTSGLARSPHDFGTGRSALLARRRRARRGDGVEPPTF